VTLPASAASAGTIPDTKLGWSSCLWPAGKTITVAVDPATHQVFLPLADENGRPVLRVMAPGGT